MLGAFLSAVALMKSGTGPAAAMSYPTGVHYKVPHGIGGGIFLPYIIRFKMIVFKKYFSTKKPCEKLWAKLPKEIQDITEVQESFPETLLNEFFR